MKWHFRHVVRSYISVSPDSSSQEVIEAGTMSESTYTKYLEQLRLEGQVERVKTPDSKREVFRLTEKGIRALELDQKVMEALTDVQSV